MAKRVYCKKPKYILATDLDGTLVGNRVALAEFNRYLIRKMNDILLVYITGRTLSSAWDLIIEENLLYPDVLVTDLGAEIYHAPRFNLDPGWNEKMLSSWDAEKTKTVIESVGGLQPQDVRPRLRLAYYTQTDNFRCKVLELDLAVRTARLPVKVVPSLGRLIDIIPGDASKGSALRYIQEFYSINKERTFACGDSGNDLSMFLKGFKGIVVGNAHPELKDALKTGLKGVYFSKSYYASGILEGLKKYGMA